MENVLWEDSKVCCNNFPDLRNVMCLSSYRHFHGVARDPNLERNCRTLGTKSRAGEVAWRNKTTTRLGGRAWEFLKSLVRLESTQKLLGKMLRKFLEFTKRAQPPAVTLLYTRPHSFLCCQLNLLLKKISVSHRLFKSGPSLEMAKPFAFNFPRLMELAFISVNWRD